MHDRPGVGKGRQRPLHARHPFSVFWADGDPTRLSPSLLYFGDAAGSRVWRLPVAVGVEGTEPELLPLGVGTD